MTEDRETYLDSSVDDGDQLQPEDTLDDGDLEDVLDRGYSPPDRAPKGYDDYPTEAERRRGESLDEKLAEEEPDVDPYAEDDRDSDREDETPSTSSSASTRPTSAPAASSRPTRGSVRTPTSRRSRATWASTAPAPRRRRRRCTSPASRSRSRTTTELASNLGEIHRLVRWRHLVGTSNDAGWLVRDRANPSGGQAEE